MICFIITVFVLNTVFILENGFVFICSRATVAHLVHNNDLLSELRL